MQVLSLKYLFFDVGKRKICWVQARARKAITNRMPIFFLRLSSGLLIITSTTSPARQSVQNSQFSQSVRLKILDGLDGLLTTLGRLVRFQKLCMSVW